jgi:hypothetical protein
MKLVLKIFNNKLNMNNLLRKFKKKEEINIFKKIHHFIKLLILV